MRWRLRICGGRGDGASGRLELRARFQRTSLNPAWVDLIREDTIAGFSRSKSAACPSGSLCARVQRDDFCNICSVGRLVDDAHGGRNVDYRQGGRQDERARGDSAASVTHRDLERAICAPWPGCRQ